MAQPGQGKILSDQHKIIMSFTLFLTKPFVKPLDISKSLGNHSLLSFCYDFFLLSQMLIIRLKSNNELLHFRTLTSYHIFPFLKQS